MNKLKKQKEIINKINEIIKNNDYNYICDMEKIIDNIDFFIKIKNKMRYML